MSKLKVLNPIKSFVFKYFFNEGDFSAKFEKSTSCKRINSRLTIDENEPCNKNENISLISLLLTSSY